MNAQPTILIVDSVEASRSQRSRELRQAGFAVLEAPSGDQGLRIIESEPVHLVVLNTASPDANVPEVHRRTRAALRTSRIPVLQISASSEPSPELRHEADADAHLAEPVQPGVLVAMAKALLRLRSAEEALGRQDERLRLLADAAERLLTAADPMSMLPVVCARLAGPLGVDVYLGFAVDASDGSLRLTSSGGLTPEQQAAAAHPAFGDGLCGSVIAQRAGTVINRLHERTDVRAVSLSAFGIRAYACNPLMAGERPLGVLSFGSRRRDEFSAEDLALFRTLARCLASATERAMLIERFRGPDASLEDQLRLRSAELQDSHERLRASERMAALGTLSAGLGHDMGNLLLPVRIRTESMERRAGSGEFREDIAAIRQCAEYLQQLANGLRLFALDPDDAGASQARTHLREWWPNVQPFMRNSLPRTVVLEHDIPADAPPAAISPQGLTQAVFNLVQNAGDAMRGRNAGRVRIAAEALPGDRVAVIVSDDGPGMSEEVRRRCTEPFFTTKTRGASTGFGLALVHGIVQKAGGEIDIDTAEGSGTTFTLILPAAVQERAEAASAERPVAVVTVADPRIQSYVRATLNAMGFDTRLDGDPGEFNALLWVAEAGHRAAAERFVQGPGPRRAIMLGGDTAEDEPGIMSVPDPHSAAAVQGRLREAVMAINSAEETEEPVP